MQEYLHLNILIKNLNFIYVLFTLFVYYLQQLNIILDNISFSVTCSVNKMLVLPYFIFNVKLYYVARKT